MLHIEFYAYRMSFVPRRSDPSVDKMAVKALVTIFGPKEASKQSGLPLGTVQSWCYRYKWRMAKNIPRPPNTVSISNKDPGQAIADAMASHKEKAEVNLAHYAARAAEKAAKSSKPLEIARAVRDVATVYRTVFPADQGGELLEGAILVGAAAVKDDPPEMLASAEVIEDVRQEIPDQRPEGD